MKRRRLDSSKVVTAATLSLVAGVAGWAGLSLLAQPPDLNARLAGVRQQTETAEDLLHGATHAADYPAGAVCGKAAGSEADDLRQAVQALARQAGVNLTRVDVTPGVGDEATGDLTPVNIQIEASGRYDQTVGLMAAMAKLRPLIFVDQSDLTSQVSAVTFKLSGHAYCSISAHL